MRDDDLSSVVLLPKLIDNSRVVRQADPRANRELFGLLILVGMVVAGLVFYSWPHLAARETGNATNLLSQERDRLVEENRKLRLEKASLEDLHRVEGIATKRLGLEPPAPDQVIVVETPKALPAGAHLAQQGEAPGETPN
jgi:cell division protein FtsL